MTSSFVGRLALALLATCVVAATLYLVFLRNEDPSIYESRVELGVARLENGPPPTHFDTGQQAAISRDPGNPGSDFVIRDGKLTISPTKAGSAAAYYSSPDLGAPIDGIGARWVFLPQGNENGAIGLVVSQNLDGNSYPPIASPLPIHFVVTPINWNLAVKRSAEEKLEVVGAGEFAEPLRVDGTTAYEVSLSIDGSRVTVSLPDGTQRIINDPRIAQWQGNFATFEVYVDDGLTASLGGFEEIWATSSEDGQ